MFKNVLIGKKDILGNEIREGDRLKFKSHNYQNREFEGTVKYNGYMCAFVVLRDNDEGQFIFYDIFDIEIINSTNVLEKVNKGVIYMNVITNNHNIAIEILSAQNLFDVDIEEITIEGVGSLKYGLNDYDAKVKIKDYEFILYRDMNFKNVNIKNILTADLRKINFIDTEEVKRAKARAEKLNIENYMD
ncbi:MAG: hypothetical protein K0R54_581 [Clostridiaceae bacterium]|jgi:hypothetical protein|nr:hypothetical protein [Clostridiaceae bacterium]